MGGTALTYDVVYDVFAKYSSATAFTLEFAKWATSTAGTSARTAAWATGQSYKIGDRRSHGTPTHYFACIQAHTSATTTREPEVSDDWEDDWLDLGTVPSNTDFTGLYTQDGRQVYGPADSGDTPFDGCQYRWLGVVMLYNNSSTANFKDDAGYRYVSNYNNKKSKLVKFYIDADYWTYAVATWRVWNGGTSRVGGKFVSCVTDSRTAAVNIITSQNVANNCMTGVQIDSESNYTFFMFHGSSLWLPMSTEGILTFNAGYHYVVGMERGLVGGTNFTMSETPS
jgi:hypothetical protein